MICLGRRGVRVEKTIGLVRRGVLVGGIMVGRDVRVGGAAVFGISMVIGSVEGC
jgi:hypothetical protein